MSGREAVHIVGLGAQTPLGRTVLSSAAAVRAGISLYEEHPFMIDRRGEQMILSRASYLTRNLDVTERLLELADQAAREALMPLHALDSPPKGKIPLFVGLPSPRPGLPEDLGARFGHRLRERLDDGMKLGPVETVETGHSAGLAAMEKACRLLREGRSRFCLVGGADTYINFQTLSWLDEQEQLRTGGNPWGLCPGEGAGFCLLALGDVAREMTSLGRLTSVATAQEENLIKTKTICTGQGLSEAWRAALGTLPQEAKISQLICDLNGEPYRADELGFCLSRFTRRFEGPPSFNAPAKCWGDVGAASGPLFLCLASAESVVSGARDNTYLVSTSSENGERGAAVIVLEHSTGRRS